MIRLVPGTPMRDRNGLELVHGDYVLAKVWYSYNVSPCQVVGFTDKYVVLIPNGSSQSCMRKSTNVIKVNNYNNWKHW